MSILISYICHLVTATVRKLYVTRETKAAVIWSPLIYFGFGFSEIRFETEDIPKWILLHFLLISTSIYVDMVSIEKINK